MICGNRCSGSSSKGKKNSAKCQARSLLNDLGKITRRRLKKLPHRRVKDGGRRVCHPPKVFHPPAFPSPVAPLMSLNTGLTNTVDSECQRVTQLKIHGFAPLSFFPIIFLFFLFRTRAHGIIDPCFYFLRNNCFSQDMGNQP